MTHRTPARLTTVLATLTLAGCSEPGPDAPTLQPLTLTAEAGAVHLSVSPNRAAPGTVLERDLRVHGLTYPTDLAPLPGGRTAVLDRIDAQVVVLDADGSEVERWGGPGDGPGEYEEPYAIASTGRHLMVMDKNARLTFLAADGRVTGTVVNVVGDIQAMWQRSPISRWEEPLQLSHEDATRRVSALGDSAFTLLIQDRDERFDASFQEGDAEVRFPHPVLAFDTAGSLLDTLTLLEGPGVRPWQRPSEMRFAFPRQRAFPMRPMWAAGRGWTATAHGSRPEVRIRFADGDTLTVTWPADPRPLGEADARWFVLNEIEALRRTKGREAETDMGEIPFDLIVDDWELLYSTERPQVMGLLGDGPCLVIQGLRPDHGGHMEATTVVVLDVREPGRGAVVSIESEPGFIRSLHGGALHYLTVEDDGTRAWERYPLPDGLCSRAADEP
ncbi:MAG: hypothetical protein RJQ04_08255 [Longimicrobiales bacterium]